MKTVPFSVELGESGLGADVGGLRRGAIGMGLGRRVSPSELRNRSRDKDCPLLDSDSADKKTVPISPLTALGKKSVPIPLERGRWNGEEQGSVHQSMREGMGGTECHFGGSDGRKGRCPSPGEDPDEGRPLSRLGPREQISPDHRPPSAGRGIGGQAARSVGPPCNLDLLLLNFWRKHL